VRNDPGRPAPGDPGSDTVDLRELATALMRGWRYVAGGISAGALVAVLLLILLPPKFDGTTTVLLRDHSDLPAMTGGGGRASGGNGGGISLGGLSDILSLDATLDTELEILTSRAVVGAIVDSLGLQVEVLRPRSTPLDSLFQTYLLSPRVREGSYSFRREQDAYRVRGPGGFSGEVVPGGTIELAGARLTLGTGNLPSRFRVRLRDRQEAISRTRRILDADQAAGEIAEVEYRASDPWTAAAVPNAVVAEYLRRRTTTDRGMNQRRYEFLSRHADSVSAELLVAERSFREQQERSGVLDPEFRGEAEMESALALRARLDQVEVDLNALDEILRHAAAGELSSRELAGYPTLMANPAINNLLSRLFDLETRRTDLLERRTQDDPDVMALDRSIAGVEHQLVELSGSYRDGLRRQQRELRTSMGRHGSTLAALPAQAEESFRLRREVQRLSETQLALQTGLVQARMAALAEGGDVRQIDPAEPPREPAFPKPPVFLVVGILLGGIGGVAGALGRAYLGPTLNDVTAASLAAGVPAVRYDSVSPVLLPERAEPMVVLLIPAGPGLRSLPVAKRIATTANLQGRTVALADLTEDRDEDAISPRVLHAAPDAVGHGTALQRRDETSSGRLVLYCGGGNGSTPDSVRRAVDVLAESNSLVVVALPQLSEPVSTALLRGEREVLLIARAGQTRRGDLQTASETLHRIGLAPAAVIVQPRNMDDDDHVDRAS